MGQGPFWFETVVLRDELLIPRIVQKLTKSCGIRRVVETARKYVENGVFKGRRLLFQNRSKIHRK